MQHPVDRRTFLEGAAAGAAALAWPAWTPLPSRGLDDIQAEIDRRHQEAVARLQRWIHQPSIAAENNGVAEGCDLTMQLLRDAGFNQVTKLPTDGQPGIFATLDAGAPRTLGVYFMYDVKQVDPAAGRRAVDLADLFCRQARGRVDAKFRELSHNADTRTYRLAQEVLQSEHRWLERGMVELSD